MSCKTSLSVAFSASAGRFIISLVVGGILGP
jgi:hypothetical protein